MKTNSLLFILILFTNIGIAQIRTNTQTKIEKIKSGKEFYDLVSSTYSSSISLSKTSFIIPKMTIDEEQLAFLVLNKNIKFNKEDVINVLSRYVKKEIERNGFKDYYMTLSFFLDKKNFKIESIIFSIPKTLLKDIKQINQLETELISKTKFTFIDPPVPSYFKPPYIKITVMFNEKDLVGKF